MQVLKLQALQALREDPHRQFRGSVPVYLVSQPPGIRIEQIILRQGTGQTWTWTADAADYPMLRTPRRLALLPAETEWSAIGAEVRTSAGVLRAALSAAHEKPGLLVLNVRPTGLLERVRRWLGAPAPEAVAELTVPTTDAALAIRLEAARASMQDQPIEAWLQAMDVLSTNSPGTSQNEASMVAAEAALELGLLQQALELWPVGSGAPEERRFRRRLAQAWYARGEYDQAWRLLADLPADGSADAETLDLVSRTLMRQGRYTEAAARLLEAPALHTPFMQYNLAVALFHSGRVAQARTVLDRLGRTIPFDTVEGALRDQANLVLGQHLLAAGQGGAAKHVLSRISLQGPHSSYALLLHGWSELAPPGEPLLRVAVGNEPPPDRYGSAMRDAGVLKMSMEAPGEAALRAERWVAPRAEMAKTREAAWAAASASWLRLAERLPATPGEPAVLEALLALAHLASERGDRGQAAQFSITALQAIQAAQEQLEKRRTALQGKPPADWVALADRREQPTPEDIRTLGALLQEENFRAALRDLSVMLQLQEALPPTGGTGLAQGMQRYAEHLSSLALRGIEAELSDLQRYRVHAHLYLARGHDPSLARPGE